MKTKGRSIFAPWQTILYFSIYRQLQIVGINNSGVNVYVDNLSFIGIRLSVFYYICNANQPSWSDKIKENNI